MQKLHFILSRAGVMSFTVLFCLAADFAQAQKSRKLQERKVETEFTGVYGNDVSEKQAKARVLEAAKAQAIANEFGKIINMSERTSIEVLDGSSQTRFVSLAASDVKGEWLETLGEEWSKKEDGQVIFYTVKLRGRIRERNEYDVDLDIKLLCNGVDTLRNRVRMNTYYHGDSLYVYFKSPVDGYLAIYITDELSGHQIAQRLLPYSHQGGDAYSILADEDYYFFSKNKAPHKDRRYVVTERMGCYGDLDVNKIYFIFSKTPFVKARDERVNSTMPDQLPLYDFHTWLNKQRRTYSEMVVKPFLVEIRK